MEIEQTGFEGLLIVHGHLHTDKRGSFLKVFNADQYSEWDAGIRIQESYYSVSDAEVVRGMHFQTPPYDHIKIVTCQRGAILDVVLDLRRKSPTFGQFFQKSLNDKDGQSLFIPKGMAHGFLSLEPETMVLYQVSSVHSSSHDKGIRYDSFGMSWPCKSPILSDRDLSFPGFSGFESPFE